MAKANPTNLGSLGKAKKNVYVPNAGDHFTFVRCDKCEAKFCKEDSDGVCPECLGKGKKTVQK